MNRRTVLHSQPSRTEKEKLLFPFFFPPASRSFHHGQPQSPSHDRRRQRRPRRTATNVLQRTPGWSSSSRAATALEREAHHEISDAIVIAIAAIVLCKFAPASVFTYYQHYHQATAVSVSRCPGAALFHFPSTDRPSDGTLLALNAISTGSIRAVRSARNII